MPDSPQALVVFLLAIIPGFLAIRGYARRTSRSVPERDFYALAGSVVISVIWLGVVWLVLLALGDPLREWGLSPYDATLLARHRADAVWLGLAVIFAPFLFGVLAANAIDRLSLVKGESAWRHLRRTRLFRAPTAWDRAWSRFAREQGAGEILVHLNGGLMIRGAFGRRSQVDLSPSPPGLYLEEGFAYRTSADGQLVALEATTGRGIYLAGSEILAIYFDEEGADGAGAGASVSKPPAGGSDPASAPPAGPAQQPAAEDEGKDR